MALPTKTTVQAGGFSSDGSPWVKVVAKSTIDVDTLQYSTDGSPWYGVEDVASTGIKWDSVLYTNVKSMDLVLKANIKNVSGVLV